MPKFASDLTFVPYTFYTTVPGITCLFIPNFTDSAPLCETPTEPEEQDGLDPRVGSNMSHILE